MPREAGHGFSQLAANRPGSFRKTAVSDMTFVKGSAGFDPEAAGLKISH